MGSARPDLPDGACLVVGLARSGQAAARLLLARGYEVVAVDSGSPELAGLDGADVVLGADGRAQLQRARWVVKSPGVPREAPVIAAAIAAGMPVMGELELAWRCLENEFIAVTGTNGKTTTVELVGHLHRVAGLPVGVAGNVGTALSSLVGEIASDATVVAECSSFQLEDTIAFAPEAAVLLNLAPDHLDRHGTLEAYREAKLRIFANQSNDDVAVAPSGIGIQDLGGCARRVCFGDAPESELSLRSGQLFWADTPLIRAEELALRGRHNVSNAMAAAAVCLARGIDSEAVAEGLRTFAGVEHRLEEVREVGGVLYVNDSKSTNVDSALVALEAFSDRPVHLIAGGRAKGQDFAPLSAVVNDCAGVHLIGEAAGELRAALGVGVLDGTLESAVAAAAATARPGDVVLLSPGCASFDQFDDFEARGRAFKALVAALPERT